MRPNHKDECDGKSWRYSGTGYNRVKLCACGAEDHAPDGSAWKQLADVLRPEYAELAELRAYRDKTEEALLAYCYLVKRAFDESEAMLVSGRTREIWSTFKEAAKIDRDGLTDLGLWREPPKDGGA